MTIQTTSSKAGPFIGNGSTTTFACNFPIDKPDDLQVVYTNALAQDTTLDPSQYTATGFGDPAGVSVTYPISGPPIGANEKLTLLRLVDYDQQTSITNQGGFYPTVIEKALDRIVMQCQQLAEKLNRAVTVSVSSNEDPAQVLVSIAQNAAAAEASAAAASGSANEAGSSAANASASAYAAEQAAASITFPISHENVSGLGTAATKDVGTAAGDVLALDENGNVPAVNASQMPFTGRLLNIVDITASGTYAKNPDASFVIVHVLGGGGGGSGQKGGSGTTPFGGSGAGGGCAIKRIDVADLGEAEAVTIGSGGAGGTTVPTAGDNGGTSSFGAHCSATGGPGGRPYNFGGDLGGIGIGGDINLRGGPTGLGGANYANSNGSPSPCGGAGAGPFGGGSAPGVFLVSTRVDGGDADPNSGSGGSGGYVGVYNSGAAVCAGGAGGSGRIVILECK